MAIYHLRSKIIQRSKGQNVVASAAYRRAGKLYDEREERHWDYRKKKNVIHKEILIPKDTPQWVSEFLSLEKNHPDRGAEKLWNTVESIEKRIDAQLAREIEFALPIELTPSQNIELAREYIYDQFVLRGMIADFSVHWDAGNPHVHVLLSMRTLTEHGFGKKELAWNNRALLREWRAKWAEYANFHLRKHQHMGLIDHRSYKEQGIELIPGIHRGRAVMDMEERGLKTQVMQEANYIREANLSAIIARPAILLDKISKRQETFSAEEIHAALRPYMNDAGSFSNEEFFLIEENLKKLNEQEKSESEKEGLRPDALEKSEPKEKQNQTELLTEETLSKIFRTIEYHESVFNERTLAKALAPYTAHSDAFMKAVLEIKSSPELIRLGVGDDGRERYTTKRMLALEGEIETLSLRLKKRCHIEISTQDKALYLERHQRACNLWLTEEQKVAVEHILKPASLSLIVGRAGTGKSFLLGSARAVWEASGLQVQGVTLSGIAAEGLMKESQISSRTIESFRCRLEAGSLQLNPHDVIVMDEAGMTDSYSMQFILKAVHDAHAKLVLVGDNAQLQPVGPGASFRAILERTGFVALETVYRQRELWQKEATVAFSTGDIANGLSAYEARGYIHFGVNAEGTMRALQTDWMKSRQNNTLDLSQYLVLAHRNEDVMQLNHLLREARIAREEIEEGYLCETASGESQISIGERLLFLKNENALGIKNGHFGVVTEIKMRESGCISEITVLLDGSDSDKAITFTPQEYVHFTYGYAATVHKAQGKTVEHAFIYTGGRFWDRHLTYVAMSRHRMSCQLYVNQSQHRTLNDLYKRLSRFGMKDSVLDFPLSFARRRNIEIKGLLKVLPKHLAKRLILLKEKMMDRYQQWVTPVEYWTKKKEAIQKHERAQKITVAREDAKRVVEYIDANRAVGVIWQTMKGELKNETKPHDKNEESKKTTAFQIQYKDIKQSIHYPTFLESLDKRNQIVFEVMKDITRYKKAIHIYALDINKMKKESMQHESKERVRAYQDYQKSKKTVVQERVAHQIVSNLKAHYPIIKTLQLDIKVLQKEASLHQRRSLLSTLTVSERKDFKVVERYQKITNDIHRLVSNHSVGMEEQKQKTIPNKAGYFKELNHLLLKRAAIAHEITENVARYKRGLEFYNIGNLGNSVLDEIKKSNPTKTIKKYVSEKEKAQLRWERLVAASKKYESVLYEEQKEREVNGTDKAQSLIVEGTESFNHALSHVSEFLYFDIQRLRDDLNASAFVVAKHYLGAPRVEQGDMLRYGSHKGSLVVRTAGERKGMWYDFQTSEGGDMLNLIQHTLREQNFKEVLKEASRFLGGESQYIQDSMNPKIQTNKPITTLDVNAVEVDKAKIEKAREIVRETQSIEGTIAERYLREHRGITQNILAESFRFHPNLYHPKTRAYFPALVVIARNEKDEITAIQAIYLNAKTHQKASIEAPKITRGSLKKAKSAVLVNIGKSDILVIAEGPETALSVATANPEWQVYATLGISNFTNVKIPDAIQKIILCADNDKNQALSQKMLKTAARKLSQTGKDVWLAMPSKIGEDFNDVLLREGAEGVREILSTATLFQMGIREQVQEEIKENIVEMEIERKTLEVLPSSIKPASYSEPSPFNEPKESVMKIDNDSISDIDVMTLEEILLKYTDMECSQTELIDEKMSLNSSAKERIQYLKEAIQLNSKAIQTFAKEALKGSKVQSEILKSRGVSVNTSSKEKGGFKGIRERFINNTFTKEDIKTVLIQLKSRAHQESRMRTEGREQSRGRTQ